jgi:hypothetical protein
MKRITAKNEEKSFEISQLHLEFSNVKSVMGTYAEHNLNVGEIFIIEELNIEIIITDLKGENRYEITFSYLPNTLH